LVQAFLKKWWVESDFKAPNLPLSLRLKGSGQKERKEDRQYNGQKERGQRDKQWSIKHYIEN
jgi:hypothetical protein